MRTAQVFSFVRRRAPPDWSAQDIAEFYRVEAMLVQSGLRVVSARGVTDEGDPWFVFCRADDDEVIIHFARIDGRYVISSPAYCGNADGYDFRALVRDMIERHPVLRPKPTGNNLFLHPAALLVMLVASAFLKSGHAAEAASSHGAAIGGTGAGSMRRWMPGCAPRRQPKIRPRKPRRRSTPRRKRCCCQRSTPRSYWMCRGIRSPWRVPRAPAPAPDASDQSLMPFAGDLTTDRPHDTQVMETSG